MPDSIGAQVRLELHGREPFAEGFSFGSSGPYERVWGRAHFAFDPNGPAYRSVVDLEYAPRNAPGLVEYSSDFYLLKPVEPSRGNGGLLYEVNNRGSKFLLKFLNDAPQAEEPMSAEHAGNGFLMRRGYTLVWSGWQGDVLPGDGRLCLRVPVATENGRPITGLVRTEFAPGVETPAFSGPPDMQGKSSILCYPLSGNVFTRSYEVASLDTSLATFTYRQYEADPRITVPPDAWGFAALDQKGCVVPSAGHCLLRPGFRRGWLYELIYTAKDPLVLGLGLPSVRDFISFAMHETADMEGNPNPLREKGHQLEKAYAWGCSQSGRFLREFVYRGYNVDAAGRQVFQGIVPFVSGAGRVWLNGRFAQPGRYPREHHDHLYPSDQFPFAYSVIHDPLSGATDGILRRPDTDPLVMHVQSSSEYWQRRGSLVHTDSFGNDLAEHEKARIYLLASAEHFPDPILGSQNGLGRYPTNPLNVTAALRALQDALDAWATDGTSPPSSRAPCRANGTAVLASVVRDMFPSIPGFKAPPEPNRLFVQMFGPRYARGVVDVEPPVELVDREYCVLVPSVDSDGNDVPGIRGPEPEAPTATYTGWNYRIEGEPEAAMAEVYGSYLPFARSLAEREARSDPRPSLEERYGSADDYARKVGMAVQRLVERRLLLSDDAEKFNVRAKAGP